MLTASERYKRWYYRHREKILARKNELRREKYKFLTVEEKARRSAANREWRSRNQVRIHGNRLAKYKLTVKQFSELLSSQNGACAICETSKPGGKGWHVDHDHQTGNVRGLLCHHCNVGIGNLKDDPALVMKAAQYLSRRGSSWQ